MQIERPKPIEVEAQLRRICGAAEFARSPQMVKLLRFLVGYSRDPSLGPLNERLIGEKIFGRQPADYDPKLDPVVRTEARRLRQKLDAYYGRAGGNDPIRIAIPKGTYAAQLEYLAESAGVASDELGRPPDVPNVPIRSVQRRNRAIWMGSLGLLVLVLLSVLWRRLPPQSSASRAEAPYEIVPFANELGQELEPAISPDGKNVAYIWDGNDGNFDIYIQPFAGGERFRLTTDPAQELYPSWSPDGKSIAFLRSTTDFTQLVVKPAAGGSERTIAQIHAESSNWATDFGPRIGNAGPVWAPDGHHLIVSDWCGPGRGFGLYSISTETFEMTGLTSPSAVVRDLYPRISPDGRDLAFVRYSTHGVGELYVQSLSGGEPIQLTTDRQVVRGVTWTPDSQRLIYGSNRDGKSQLWTIERSGGAPTPVPTNTSFASDPSATGSENSLLFVVENQNWTIWRARLHDGRIAHSERLLSSSGRSHSPRYSPDGRRIAFVSDRSGSWEIWVCDHDGQNPKQLTHFKGPWLGGLNWSPDGHRLAFDGRISRHSSVFLIDANGGEAELLEMNDFENRMPAFSQNGRFIYFNSNRSRIVTVWKMPLGGGAAVSVSGITGFQSMESAQGSELYFDSGTTGIWRSHPDGSGQSVIPALARVSPRLNWTAGKRGIYFLDITRDPTNIWLYSFPNQQITMIGEAGKPFVLDTPSLSLSPDEQWLLYGQQEHTSSDIEIRRMLPRSK